VYGSSNRSDSYLSRTLDTSSLMGFGGGRGRREGSWTHNNSAAHNNSSAELSSSGRRPKLLEWYIYGDGVDKDWIGECSCECFDHSTAFHSA
jgi:hypothetical protein